MRPSITARRAPAVPGAGALVLLAVVSLFAMRGAWSASQKMPEAESTQVWPTSGLAPCSTRLQRVPLGASEAGTPASGAAAAQFVRRAFNARRMLGVEENMHVVAAGPREAPVLRVSYPQNSASFSLVDKGHPLGGSAFYAPIAAGAPDSAVCLRYRVRFPEGFDFVKGGKLPGLYAGAAPSGGEEVTGDNGWSVRVMWREYGEGELYEYIVNKPGEFGLSVGRGAFRFVPGRWTTVELEIVPNTPGKPDGVARLWIDDGAVIEQHGVVFRTQASDGPLGLMFSTFFGGGDKSWATRRDQYAEFSGFQAFRER